ncbi:MAG: phospholipid ABC transporter ATP-binding protein MlaF, partial [Gammaproteobacteria bacterium]
LGVTSIVVSHDVAETASISDYLYVISGGKVVGQGTRQTLAETRSEWVRQFLDGSPDGPVNFHYPAPDYADDLQEGSAA